MQNKKTNNDWLMVYSLTCYTTPLQKGSDSLQINARLPRISAEMLLETNQAFWTRVTYDVAGTVLSSLSCTIKKEFSIGDRSGGLDCFLVIPHLPGS